MSIDYRALELEALARSREGLLAAAYQLDEAALNCTMQPGRFASKRAATYKEIADMLRDLGLERIDAAALRRIRRPK